MLNNLPVQPHDSTKGIWHVLFGYYFNSPIVGAYYRFTEFGFVTMPADRCAYNGIYPWQNWS